MVPRWFPGYKKEPFGVTLGVFLKYFDVFWVFYTTCIVFVQACVDFRFFVLIKDCNYNSFTLFSDMFFICLSLLCRRGRGRAARRGWRPLELLGHASTRSSFLLHPCLLCLWMQQLWNNCFYNALALNALPVPLLRQVYFLVCLSLFFSCWFSVRFRGVLEATFGVRRVLWVSFGTHFGVIFVTF